MAEPWTASSSVSLGRDGSAVTLVDESTFCISDPCGDVLPEYPHGLFFRDTRFVSGLRLQLNGRPPELLEATSTEPFSATFVLRDHPAAGLADSPLMVLRRRYVGQGMREDITLRNFGETPTHCRLELVVGGDFADLFEVKAGRIRKHGELSRRCDGHRLVLSHRRGAFRRSTVVTFAPPVELGDDVAVFDVVVPRRGEWSTCVEFAILLDELEIRPRYCCGEPIERSMPSLRLEQWRRQLPVFTVEDPDLARLLRRSTEDLAALRIFDPEHPDRAVVAAGAPWFMTLFGRDSLITSWAAMLVDPDLALGTLQTLARFQGTTVDASTEEEPGRILHEVRFGKTAQLSLGGGQIYYGTADATPLFVMLLGELGRWGTRRAEVDALLPAADRALAWIDEFGDRDGDGYVEYQRATERGLENQGWKDSWDAVRFAGGDLARAPIAICEVQAYVYAALKARAEFATERDDHTRAWDLNKRAAGLKEAFNRDFWLEEHGWYAMGLDRDKRPIDALTSNIGHCLWAGIIDEERAPVVAEQLLSKAMFSGWGIRTLATSMAGYNPVSYHNGSVWPHDNAICVAGLMRYGLVEEAQHVMKGLVAAAAFTQHRLPELFSGIADDDVATPVGYPTSCSPQAWAAATPLLLLRSMLRFEPDAGNARLHLAPAIPEWVGRVRIEGIPITDGQVSLEAHHGELRLLDAPDGLTIEPTPRPPAA